MTETGSRQRRTELVWETPQRMCDGRRTSVGFRTRLPEDYPYFEGHFRSYPVLAGAVQLHELVLPCLRQVLPEVGPLRELTGLKFPSRIVPGDSLEVTLELGEGSLVVDFSIDRGGVRCTQGRLRFAAPSDVLG